jgi:hypothetical protein
MQPVYGPLRGNERIGGGIKGGALLTGGARDREPSEHLAGFRRALQLLSFIGGADICVLACTEISAAFRHARVVDPLEGNC